MKIQKRVLLLCLIGILQGCVNAAVTGAQAVYGRHGIQNSLSDQYIMMKAERTIYLDTNEFENTNVSVESATSAN
jgi:hypothetical protein